MMDGLVELARERRRWQSQYPHDRDARINQIKVLAKAHKRRNMLVARFGTDRKAQPTPEPTNGLCKAHFVDEDSNEKLKELLRLGADETHLPPSNIQRGLTQFKDLRREREPRITNRMPKRLTQEAIDEQRKLLRDETMDVKGRPEDPVDVVKSPPLPSLLSFVMQKPRSDLKALNDRAALDKAAEEQAAADKAAAAQAAATILAKTASYRTGLDNMSTLPEAGEPATCSCTVIEMTLPWDLDLDLTCRDAEPTEEIRRVKGFASPMRSSSVSRFCGARDFDWKFRNASADNTLQLQLVEAAGDAGAHRQRGVEVYLGLRAAHGRRRSLQVEALCFFYFALTSN
jgi:hypothetical protein